MIMDKLPLQVQRPDSGNHQIQLCQTDLFLLCTDFFNVYQNELILLYIKVINRVMTGFGCSR